MPGPATKLGSLTGHGGTVVGPGCPTVLINKVPAIRVGADMHLCPMVTPGVPPIPHVGMNCVGPGVPTVLIGKLPASTMGDNFLCVGPPAPVIMGAMNVLIGTGGGGGGGGSTTQASAAQGLKAGTLQPIRGTETFPIDVQATLLTAANYMTPQEMHLQIKVIADALAESASSSAQEAPEHTIADIVEILEAVEREEGYEAARFFSSYLDYGRLTEMAKGFISGQDTNSENDPNQMPTRFMLLYGADDNKLQQIDDHPDRADGEEHKINVANLRKGLKALGYEVAETGAYDEEVLRAHTQYMAAQTGASAAALQELQDEDQNAAAQSSASPDSAKEKFTVRFEIDPNDPDSQDDKFTLYSSDKGRKYSQVKTVKDDADSSNKTLELVFTGLEPSLNYTLEYDPGSSGKIEVVFRNRPFGKWF